MISSHSIPQLVVSLFQLCNVYLQSCGEVESHAVGFSAGFSAMSIWVDASGIIVGKLIQLWV